MELTASQQIPQVAKTAPIRWCLYARKSSEQDERQALSIEQQMKEMELLADHWGIEIAEVRKEATPPRNQGLDRSTTASSKTFSLAILTES